MMVLDTLRISPRELEKLTGFEVNDFVVGGLIGGVYRFSKLKYPTAWGVLCFFEGVIAALLAMISLPLGLWLAKSSPMSHPAQLNQAMVLVVGGTAAGGLILWNGWMLYQRRLLNGLMHLLDEVDGFHYLLQSVEALQKLQSSQFSDISQEVWEGLQITRDCLVTGLKTERVLREQRQFLARLEDGFTQLEQYQTTLQTLDLEEQAQEYSSLLQQTLKISQIVQAELKNMRQVRHSQS